MLGANLAMAGSSLVTACGMESADTSRLKQEQKTDR